MDKKFKLNNVLLYIKGFYKCNTVNGEVDIVNDLIDMLRLDDYTPQNILDVYYIIMREFSNYEKENDFDLYRFMTLIGQIQQRTLKGLMESSLRAIYQTLRYDLDATPDKLPIYDKKHRRISTDHQGMTYKEMSKIATRILKIK